jgi:hypothetical protein
MLYNFMGCQMSECGICGHVLEDDDEYCAECGTYVKED